MGPYFRKNEANGLVLGTLHLWGMAMDRAGPDSGTGGFVAIGDGCYCVAGSSPGEGSSPQP